MVASGASASLNYSVFMHMVLDFGVRTTTRIPMPVRGYPCFCVFATPSPIEESDKQVIYLSDIHTGHIVVLDSALNRSWKLSSTQMARSNTRLRVKGGARADEVFVMTFGVNGIALASNKTHVSEKEVPLTVSQFGSNSIAKIRLQKRHPKCH